MTRSILRLALIVFALVGFHARDAHAHAVLLDSAPQDGAVLAHAPAEIVLHFNEPVVPVALRVLDGTGRSVDVKGPGTTADSTVRAALPADLPAGSYLVSWRVVSADSHPIGAAFTFSVGRASATLAVDDQNRREAGWKAAVIANRAVGDAALLLAAGAALAMLLVFGAALPRGGSAIMSISAVVAVVSAALSIPLARGWIAAAPVQDLLAPATWALGADAPHRLRTALIAIGMVHALFGLRRRHIGIGCPVACLGALLACAGLPLSGHVAALVPAWPGQIALFLHAAAAAFWIGALPLLALALRQAPPGETYRLLRRFSAIAIAGVALLVLAGVGVALTHIRDIAALTDSEYGRILLIKVALVALMLALAIANRRLTPALSSASGTVTMRLKRNIALEIALAAAIVAVTAWLGHTRPPDELPHAHEAASGPAFVTVESDGASLLVEIAPGRRGPNRLTGHMTGADGRPIAAREVAVELSLPAAGVEPLTARAVSDGNGTFTVDAIALPLAGRWQMRVDALIGDFEKRVFSIDLDVD